MTRWPQAVVVSDNPRPCRTRRLQGSHRDAPRTISDRIFLPTPVTLPLRGSLPSLDLALQRSLGFPPVHLAASLWASLAPTLRWSLEVRRAFVSELETGCASRHARSMDFREIQTFSPPFSPSSPSTATAIPNSSPCWAQIRSPRGLAGGAIDTGIAGGRVFASGVAALFAVGAPDAGARRDHRGPWRFGCATWRSGGLERQQRTLRGHPALGCTISRRWQRGPSRGTGPGGRSTECGLASCEVQRWTKTNDRLGPSRPVVFRAFVLLVRPFAELQITTRAREVPQGHPLAQMLHEGE